MHSTAHTRVRTARVRSTDDGPTTVRNRPSRHVQRTQALREWGLR